MSFNTFRYLFFVIVTIGISFTTYCNGQVIRFVSTTGTNNDPTTALSWISSTADFQGAINASAPGDQVWVAQGIYKPTTLTGPASRTVSFAMKNEVAIYGGFVGNESALAQRPIIDPFLSQYSSTTLSGDIGVANTSTDNSYHVFRNPSNLSNAALLDGFVIAAGNANKDPDVSLDDNIGGGMQNSGTNPGVCSPTLRNCLFINNQAKYGGALANTAGAATLNGNGGSSSPIISNCSFVQNQATSLGGAIYNYVNNRGGVGNPTLTRCTFIRNSAPEGGAIYGSSNFYCTANPTLLNCIFDYNIANAGAAIKNNTGYMATSTPILTNCSFFANTAFPYTTPSGGAFHNEVSQGVSSPQFTNCSFQSNQGVMHNYRNSNTGKVEPLMTNCVLFRNGDAKTFTSWSDDKVQLDHCLIDSIATGYTSVSSLTTVASPFLNSISTTLSPCSAAINTGLNSATGLVGVIIDLAGNPRISQNQVDMGAYEFSGSPAGRSKRLYVNASATGTKSGLDWANAFTDLQAALFYPCVADTLEIWVARGAYKPTATTSRDVSFALRNNVTIYGGFAGTETSLNERPAVTPSQPSSSTLSGDIGIPNNSADNSYHVIRNSAGLTDRAVLDGFVITGGNADDNNLSNRRDVGGGIYNDGRAGYCNPTIRNCLLVNNSASLGGGIYNEGTAKGTSNPTIINCIFRNNAASSGGGAIYNVGRQGISSPTIINCAFVSNKSTTTAEGGAIRNSGDDGISSPLIINCSFYNNQAFYGGAITSSSYQGTSNTTLDNCVIFGANSYSVRTSFGSRIVAQYCLFEKGVEGYTNGPGNLTTADLPFADTTSLRLSGTSIAVNAGNPASRIVSTKPYSVTGLPAKDLANQPRLVGARVDIGAYEYQTTLDASIRSIQDGLWNDPATWSCGCIPSQEQYVQINHKVIIPSAYQALGLKVNYGLGGRIIFNNSSRLRLDH